MNIDLDSLVIPEGHRLLQATHRAMATTFRVVMLSPRERIAKKAAQSCFRLVDELEGLLSRFRHGSDIHVVNHTPAGYPARVGPDCWSCLLLAHEVWQLTGGLSDITVGTLIEWRRANPTEPPPASLMSAVGFQKLHLLPDYRAVVRANEELLVDLGSLGKGYAIDRLARHLREDWEIDTFLIESGTSTAFFSTADDSAWSWPAAIPSANGASTRLAMHVGSLSGSAAELKPAHLVNPLTGEFLAPEHAAWAFATTAAFSDALSTAFSLMNSDQVRRLCQQRTDIGAHLLLENVFYTFGNFPSRECQQ